MIRGLRFTTKGSRDSGNFGHAGRPGSVGGSAPGGGSSRSMSDSEIKSKLNDDRLLTSFSEGFKPDFAGMSVEDRLRYYELAPSERGHPPEFTYTKYDFQIKNPPENATPDELRKWLKDQDVVKPHTEGDYKTPKIRVEPNDLLVGLNNNQKDEFVEKFPPTLKNMVDANYGPYANEYRPRRGELSINQVERLSDNFVKITGTSGFETDKIYENILDSQKRMLGPFSSNKDVALTEVLSSWAITGGGIEAQHIIRETSASTFDVNSDIKFYTGENYEAPFYSPTRMGAHILSLKNETEQFYKAKFATKRNPNPDLSAKFIDVYRGIGGHPIAYTPSAIESWTTQKSSANKYGKMMSDRKDAYSLLSSKVSYNNVLWTYESVKGKYGWPPESELKGKKECALFGGTIQDISMEKLYGK